MTQHPLTGGPRCYRRRTRESGQADGEEGDRVLAESDAPDVRSSRRGRVALVVAILVAGLLAVGAGAAVAARNEAKPARFQAFAVLAVDQEPAVSTARDNGILVKLTSLRITFVDALSTQVFATGLASDLGVDPGTGLGASVVGLAPPGSLLLKVMATASTKGRAVLVAQGAADKLVKDLQEEQTRLGLPADARITLTVVTPAVSAVQVAPLRKTSLKQGGGAAAAVLLVGLALVAVVRRRR
jgi:hypothetical protein